MINEITVSQLKHWQDTQYSFQLIDIREDEEVALGTIGGEHIPMARVLNHLDKIRKDIPVVVHCNSGKRSSAVVYTLMHKHQYNNVHSLCGGIQAYAAEINPAVFQAY
ncbi:MAG: rhodanese-like domain-containing protein [Flavobacteriales bacterium]|jgi:rhodanese-related sulfurtransferase